MQIELKPAGSLQFQLEPGQVVTSPRLDGLTVEALGGAIWITFASEGVDHVLKPGERLQLGAGGKAVLEALEASSLIMRAPAESEPARDGVIDRIARRFAHHLSACFADSPVCARNWVHTQSTHRFSLETL
jgi:hypothetical protein